MSDESAPPPAPTADALACAACGAVGFIRHADLGALRLGYELALARALDPRIERIFGVGAYYDGEPISESDYRARVEALARPCRCGGVFRFVPT